MATLKAAIALYDGVTSPLQGMNRAMNIIINSFESMQMASSNAVDVASIQQARGELARAETAFDGIAESIRNANQGQQNLNNSIRGGSFAAGGLWSKVKGIAGAVGAGMGLQKIIGLADNMASTKARLTMLVDDGGSVNALEDKIMASANRSRAAYQTTVNAVAQMGLMAGDTFANNDEIIRFTETLNKQFAIFGTPAAGAEAAVLQLTQAMASGVLRGEELTSVFEQAPNVIESIASYMDVPIGKIRDMAADGQITAEIVKNAMLSSADEVDARFSQMPMTFAQVGNILGNTLLQTFDPVIQAIGRGAQLIYDNWSTLEPIFWGLASAVGAYVAITAVWKAITWLQVAANRALALSMLINPITLIAVAIGVIIALIVKWVQSVGGIQVAWLTATNAIMTAWDWVKIGFFTGVYWVIGLWNKMMLAFQTASTNIQNFMGDMKTGVLMILQNMVNGAIDIINDFISLLNKIPGVNIDLIGQATFGTTAQLENEAAKAARNSVLEDYRANIDAGFVERDAALSRMKSDAREAAAGREANIMVVQAEARAKNDDIGTRDSVKMYDQVSDIAANTAAMSDSLSMAEEDLTYLRDIAEREVINRYTTAEITIHQNNENHIDKNTDFAGIMDAWVSGFAEKLDNSPEGVHA